MSGQMVSFPSNGKTAQGYLSLPASGKGKGVIVIQEYWGLVPHIKDVADRFAREGFATLAPDMFHGQQTKEPGEAGKLMMALKIDEAERDLRGAINYLVAHPAVGNQKVGTVGFCMGGQLSLYAACKNPKTVGACVVFYGVHPNFRPDLDGLAAPVLGIFAEKDGFVTPEVVRRLERDCKSRGKQAEIHIYPNTDHAFFNDTRPDVYDKQAAEDAWRRTLAFLREHL